MKPIKVFSIKKSQVIYMNDSLFAVFLRKITKLINVTTFKAVQAFYKHEKPD